MQKFEISDMSNSKVKPGRGRTQEQWQELLNLKYGSLYKLVSLNSDCNSKSEFTCSEHGPFTVHASILLGRGQGCKTCTSLKPRAYKHQAGELYDKIVSMHPNLNIHPFEKEYAGSRTQVMYTCAKHGLQTKELRKLLEGVGCAKCATDNRTIDFDEFVRRSNQTHNNRYTYDKEDFDSFSSGYVTAICAIHGRFRTLAQAHSTGSGCPECGIIRRSTAYKVSFDDFVERARTIHGNRYTYDASQYDSMTQPTIITCSEHGEFIQVASYHIHSESGCPKCSVRESKGQTEMFNYLAGLGVQVSANYRYGQTHKKEIDIYVKGLKLGIEYDGLPWHSTKYRTKEQQLAKSTELADLGIRLIRIFEDEWLERKGQIKEYLNYQFGKVPDNYYVADCSIIDISPTEAETFHNSRQVKMQDVKDINKALVYKDKIVAVLSMSSTQKGLKLLCFSSAFKSAQAGKALLTEILRETKAKYVEAYMDNRLESSDTYFRMGFTNPVKIGAKFKYWLDGSNNREDISRQGFPYYQIYDDGLTKWELNV